MGKRPEQYFRACVGAVILRDDKVLLLERRRHPGSWQLPQGGLDAGEAPEAAALREVEEETGIRPEQLTVLMRHPEVLTYELPPEWRSSRTGLGQAQFWYFLHLDAGDEAITLGDGEEFSAWRWATMGEAIAATVDFRKPIYRSLARYLPAALGHLPSAPLGPVSLRPIEDGEAVRAMIRLRVRPDQEPFVAPNGVSIAEAGVSEAPWLRGIYAGETAVGLILLYDDPEKPTYYLWRLLVGARYQRRGYGREAVLQAIAYVRTRPDAAELMVSYVPGEGCPEPFYRGLGFVPTGRVVDGEVVMSLDLTADPG